MSLNDLTLQIEDMQERVTQLHKQTNSSSSHLQQLEVMMTALAELGFAIDELQLANQQLQAKNEELAIAHQTIAAERQRYQQLFEEAPDAYLVTDTLGVIVEANSAAASLLGSSPRYLPRRPLANFVPKEEREFFRTQLSQLSRGEGIFEWEVNFSPPKQPPVFTLVRVAVVRNSRDTNISFRWLIRDISQRKQAEEALRKLSQTEREKTTQLELALTELQRTQEKLILNEKMASLGQLMAGVAHEINNPVGFIYANIAPATEYTNDLLHLIELYQQHYPHPVAEIAQQLEIINPDFITEDFPKLLESMKIGAERIIQIVVSLRNFSRVNEAECKRVDIHEGIDNTLLILQHRLKQQPHRPEIQVIKEYGQLPQVECYPGQLNQVFMNLLCNAINALDELNKEHSLEEMKTYNYTIYICTEVNEKNSVAIRIADNGSGMSKEVQQKIFDPFFTTKSVGQGTGLGLSISYQIVVEKHSGKLQCISDLGQGTEFVISLPICQRKLP
ncbi:MAG TPA: PAS domain-containing sensor histidine kinase [Cyanobacteria bacterium UBA8553]|nr:PAS domain-containing sensor histidine kinase [Cyanobacteria bacterium UBA8553]